jgi:hypothetical protein
MTELNKDTIYGLCISTAFLRNDWDNQTALHEIDDPENSVPNLECWGEIVALANFYAKWVGVPEIIDAPMVVECLFSCEEEYLEKLEQVMKEAA